jgi:hypothetical protein
MQYSAILQEMEHNGKPLSTYTKYTAEMEHIGKALSRCTTYIVGDGTY